MKNIKKMIYAAMFAAFTGVLSQIIIPLPFAPVPVNPALIMPMLSGLVLGVKWGTLSQIIYVLAGACGIPVFAGLRGGLTVLLGPTGGYLFGYILCAAVTGILAVKLKNFKYAVLITCICGADICLTTGTLWFILITKTNILTAVATCVLPFLPGDILKVIACTYIYKALEKRKFTI